MRTFVVELMTRYIVTLDDSFRQTYTDNQGIEQSRGSLTEIARDLAIRGHDRALSELDGYADLPDSAATVREDDFDSTVYEA